MASRMMRWRPWPPLLSKKFQVKLVVKRVEGVGTGDEAATLGRKIVAEVRWKGPKLALSSLRRTAKRNRTREEEVSDGGMVEWNEEFETVCTLTAQKENAFLPWEVVFSVFNGSNQSMKTKESVLGVASLNIAELTSVEQETELYLPLLLPGATESTLYLHLALSILELRSPQDSSEIVLNPLTDTSSPLSGDATPSEKDELSALKAGLRKVKILTEFVSTGKSKKTCPDDDGSEGKCSARSDDAEYNYPFDTDSPDDFDEEAGENKEDTSARKSFSYGTLAAVNNVGNEMKVDGEYEDWVYYNHRRSDVGCSQVEDGLSSIPEFSMSKRSILPWKKRKLSFRSPKPKGEPLLNKANEDGGDDIDYDRRMLSSSDESLSASRHKGDDGSALNSFSDFGDDRFVIGNWESKELVSRDGSMKLATDVFFASIDQRSEQVSGESACTVLVAVIANWFHTNHNMMPIQSQFDSLIREGSLEWRNLCENHVYQECFPDKHFDLETVLQAKIRPLAVAPTKSFIGFFHPKGTNTDSGFEFLNEAMSFDSIWDEISRAGSDCSSNTKPQLYIVSWNDHFFILTVEHDAYYIIDTLGERLYEGCQQAYILKFDHNTTIHLVSNNSKNGNSEANNTDQERINVVVEGELVGRGKESCKEYIKSFLAAIPIRELQADVKKGRMPSTLLHQRLQVEFHFTESAGEFSLDAQSASPEEEANCKVSWPLRQDGAFAPAPVLVI